MCANLGLSNLNAFGQIWSDEVVPLIETQAKKKNINEKISSMMEK